MCLTRSQPISHVFAPSKLVDPRPGFEVDFLVPDGIFLSMTQNDQHVKFFQEKGVRSHFDPCVASYGPKTGLKLTKTAKTQKILLAAGGGQYIMKLEVSG